MGCKFKIAKCYALIMIYKCFYKHEARADNYDCSHLYAYCDPETEKWRYQPISHKIFGYYGYNELSPDAVQYQGIIVKTRKIWSI